MLPKILLLLGSVLHVAAFNPNLKYFSVWELETIKNASLAAGWSNFVFTSSDLDTALSFSQNGPPLLHIRDVFFDGASLHVDWQARWNATASKILPHILNKQLLGVFLGDELTWNCIPWSNVSAAADAVRSSFPRGQAIIYYNEAFPPFVDQKMWHYNCPNSSTMELQYPSVPNSLDWISIDYYPDEGTVQGARSLVTDHIYPKMSDNQHFLFVPPAYGAGGNASIAEQICCNQNTRDGANPECHGDCLQGMLQWASDCYDWARADPRLIGLNPWHWDGPMMKNTKFEPGLANLAPLRAAYTKIGTEIVQGTQRDIDFQLE